MNYRRTRVVRSTGIVRMDPIPAFGGGGPVDNRPLVSVSPSGGFFGGPATRAPVAGRRSLSSRTRSKLELVLGYASATGVGYWAPDGPEMILPGAFGDFLKVDGRCRVTLSHGDTLVRNVPDDGMFPLLDEDDVGLLAAFYLDPEDPRGNETIRGLRSGRLTGMSMHRIPVHYREAGEWIYHDAVRCPEICISDTGANPCALAILADDPPRACPPTAHTALDEATRLHREYVFLRLRRLATMTRTHATLAG